MGFLSAIKSVAAKAVAVVAAPVKAIAAPVLKTVAKVLDVTTVAVTHPVAVVKAIASPTKTVSQVIEKHFSEPLPKQITETVVNTIVAAGAVVGIGAAATAGIGGTVAALTPTTVKGGIVAALVAPVAIGAIISRPSETLGAIAELPSGLANVGGNIAELATDPSLAHAKELITENPVIVGAAAAAAAILGAKAILPAIVGAKQIEAVQEQTEAIREAGGKPTTIQTGDTILPTAPVTPKTERVVTTAPSKTSAKRKKRTSEAAKQNISQRVNVIVANKSTSTGVRQTHKYLNRELLVN